MINETIYLFNFLISLKNLKHKFQVVLIKEPLFQSRKKKRQSRTRSNETVYLCIMSGKNYSSVHILRVTKLRISKKNLLNRQREPLFSKLQTPNKHIKIHIRIFTSNNASELSKIRIFIQQRRSRIETLFHFQVRLSIKIHRLYIANRILVAR